MQNRLQVLTELYSRNEVASTIRIKLQRKHLHVEALLLSLACTQYVASVLRLVLEPRKSNHSTKLVASAE